MKLKLTTDRNEAKAQNEKVIELLVMVLGNALLHAYLDRVLSEIEYYGMSADLQQLSPGNL